MINGQTGPRCASFTRVLEIRRGHTQARMVESAMLNCLDESRCAFLQVASKWLRERSTD